MPNKKTGAELADEGMQLSFFNAPEEWREAALEAVRQTALTNLLFTADEIYKFIPKHLPEPNKSALGGVMRRSVSLGYMVNTGQTRKSVRPEQHCDEKRLWRSLIYTGQVQAA